MVTDGPEPEVEKFRRGEFVRDLAEQDIARFIMHPFACAEEVRFRVVPTPRLFVPDLRHHTTGITVTGDDLSHDVQLGKDVGINFQPELCGQRE